MHAFEIPVGRLNAIVAAFEPMDAASYNLMHWSLKPLQKQEDVPGNALLASALGSALGKMGVWKALAPHVAPASGCIVTIADLTDRISLGNVEMYRNQDLPADGAFLSVGQAFVMSSAGCPVIIASGGGYLIVAHAGRDSLIERAAVLGMPARSHLSVVNAIIEKFRKRDVPPDDIVMVMLFAIPARSFEHSGGNQRCAPYNRALANFVEKRWPGGIIREGGHVFLDLERVFIEQACRAGIRRVWAAHSLDGYPRLVHTRDGGNPARRNLIVVKRIT